MIDNIGLTVLPPENQKIMRQKENKIF